MGIVSGTWLAARAGRHAPFIISSAVVVILGMTRWLLEFISGFNRFSVYILSFLQLRLARYLYNERSRRLRRGTIRGRSLLHVGKALLLR